ncbi:hypothetical protein BegalDRAFT_1332 [Beggiatoa alba B18LD]|uniref:Uncharacterized protein n=1 Tax=Beggiatoa alba B18LD TaxID=395493 RepID=I3CF35_9GAMM|nr:hypothetical protein [Beggiatoa alba]EIJ42228.1 hypothetical protein BegalDRAFT_1332 [Beggiatoa alba B18LD]
MFNIKIVLLSTAITLIPFVSYSAEINGNSSQAENAISSDVGQQSLRPRKRSNTSLPPSLWSINVYEAGDFCYNKTEYVNLWRADTSEPVKITIQSQNNPQQEVILRWPTHQTTLTWPNTQFPLSEDNLAYIIQVNDIGRLINIHRLPEQLNNASATEQAKWMQQKGCARQAEMLLNTDINS